MSVMTPQQPSGSAPTALYHQAMKRLVASVLIILAGGCSTHPASASATSSADPRQRFLQVMHKAFPGLPDTKSVEIGQAICTALDKGATPEQVATAQTSTGIDKETDRIIIYASVLAFCPKYTVPVANWTS